MAVVSPLTNDVSGNIDIAISELEAGISLALVVNGLVLRDVRAMVRGGAEQGQHFRDAASAWDGLIVPSVRSTYVKMHSAYRDGWLRIADVLGRRFIDDDEIDTVVLMQSAAAEEPTLQIMNATWEERDIVRRLAKAVATYFMAVTEPA
jgi:hypothetical protein